MSRNQDIRLLLKIALMVVLSFAAVVALLLGGAIAYNFYLQWEFDKRSPIAAMSKTEFQKRVYARFPIGTAETDLISVLTSQGFRQVKPINELPDEALQSQPSLKSQIDGELVLSPGPGGIRACGSIWRVRWQRNVSHRISAIYAAQSSSSCL